MFYPNIIMAKFSFPKSSKGYRILCLALQEAMKLYPEEFSMDQLCMRIQQFTGGKNPKSVQRLLNRTVESIWKNPYNSKLLEEIYQYPVKEKTFAKDFICSFVEYAVQHPEVMQSRSFLILWRNGSSGTFTTKEGRSCTINYLDEEPDSNSTKGDLLG